MKWGDVGYTILSWAEQFLAVVAATAAVDKTDMAYTNTNIQLHTCVP